jgi:ATP-dependent DNA ligase
MTAVRWNNSYRVVAAAGFIEPALPRLARKSAVSALWVHEIKHDGYRLMVRKSFGDQLRIYTSVARTGRLGSRASSKRRSASFLPRWRRSGL